MRILFISNLYPPHHLGGMELRCEETVNRLRARGHVCQVLTSRHGVQGRSPPEKEVSRTLHLQANINYYRPLDYFLQRPRQDRANRRALRQTLGAFKPDIVFIWGMWNLSPRVAYWAEQWLPGRVAYAVASYWLVESDVHESYWKQPACSGWGNALKAPARWLALRMLARERQAYPLELEHVTCVSKFVRRKLRQAGTLPHGARVIYNGIDPRPFVQEHPQSPRRGPLRLVYVGGMLPHKGVHTSVEALGLLEQRDEANGIHLTLVGGGHPEYEAQLKRRVAELGLGEHVTFHGRAARERIPALLRASDVFLFTSIWEEPIARSVMEAMAAALAIVATPVGGQPEMFKEGENALVFPPDDAGELAKRILRLRQDPDLRARLAEAGQRTVLERFTISRMVDQMETYLADVAAG